MKYNSMKLEEFYSNLERKELNKFKINNIIFDSINDAKIENIKYTHFHTERNERFPYTNAKRSINKK